MLQNVYYGNRFISWIISASIIVFALIVNWIITLINKKIQKRSAGKSRNYFSGLLMRTLENPLKFGIVLAAIWFALARLDLSKQFDNAIYEAYKILTVLNITWFIAHLASGLIQEYFAIRNERFAETGEKKHYDLHIVSLTHKSALFIIWAIGIVTALDSVGISLKAILGTLGIGGVAIALAAQDTVKNIFGGFTILMDGTFRIGDRVQIGDYDGIVEDIGIRSTKIRNFDMRVITLPNYKLVDNYVVNVSSAPKLRVVNTLGLEYTTTPEQLENAMKILTEIAQWNDKVDDEGISATFQGFGESALKIRFCYFVKDANDSLDTPSNINFEILKQFNAAGLKFAFPTQTIYFEKDKGAVNVLN